MIDKPIGWFDIWEEEPPRYEEIEFLTGDCIPHKGMLIGFEKLRKCEFHDFDNHDLYECDGAEIYEQRVLFWRPIKEED